MADKAKLLQVAQKHLSKGNLDKAIKTFQQLVEVDPRDQRLILRLADIQARAGRKKEAIENYEKVATGYIRQDFTPKAIAVYKTILRLDPELLSAYEKLAELYKAQGLEAEALSQFENLFQVYERKNNEDKQIEVLKLMADMDPENLGFQVRLGETLANKGRKKEAAEAFAKAAATLSRRGFHDRASQLFEKITALNPDNTAVRRELCAHYLESGQFEEARAEIEAILEIEPDDPRMVLLLGRILFQLGKKAEAEEKLSRSIGLFLEAGELESVMREFLFVAQSHLKNGEIDEAEAFYRQIMVNVPGEVRAIKGLVSVAETRKDRVGQIENLLVLGRTMQQSGDQEGAGNAYRKVHDLDPLNEEARNYIDSSGAAEPSDAAEPAAIEDDEVVVTDLEEIEELEDVHDVEEMELLDGGTLETPDSALEEGPEEIQFMEGGGLEDALLEDLDEPVEFLDQAQEDEAVPDIVLEGFDDDEISVEVEGLDDEVVEDVEPDDGPAVEEEPRVEEEMSIEELLAEADVYERYGLGDKVAETLHRARALAPEDQTVLDRIAAYEAGLKTDVMPPVDEEPVREPLAVQKPDADPFEEDLEEADFYHSQGLDDEASRIYQSILERDPRHQRALEAMGNIQGRGTPAQPVEPEIPLETAIETAPPQQTVLESQFDPEIASQVKSKLIVEDSSPDEMDGFFDIADDLRAELADDMDTGTEPGPADGPVSFEEIFSQFKKGIEETLGDEEYETHYNLGIAYKDMGLYDDAIREFESGALDPALAQDSYSLMAMCYVEKKEFDPAVNAIEKALGIATDDNQAGLYYQLGVVREKQKQWALALDAYEQVQSRDPAFEGISQAIERAKGSLSVDSPEEDAAELSGGSGMDDMLSDLIKEVEEMARESSGETPDDPGKSKKDRISYL